MGKYTLEKKLVAVRSYCSGELGQKAVAKQYKVDVSSLRQWIAAYRAHGIDGLKAKKRELYSADFKLRVLKRVEEEHLSYRQAAALFDIRKFDIIGHWKRQYEEGGIELLSRGPGRKNSSMTTQPNCKPKLQADNDEKRTREELLEEVNQLRMENAYLKKLEALAQENKQTTLREKRKSCLS